MAGRIDQRAGRRWIGRCLWIFGASRSSLWRGRLHDRAFHQAYACGRGHWAL